MPFAEDVAEILEIADHPNLDATCFHVRLKAGYTQDDLSRRLAIFMAATLTAASESAFDSWRDRFEGGPPLSAEDREEVAAYLMPDLQPPAASDPHETRLIGAVVEHLWSAISQHLDGDWGRPIHVERDHFSVLDPGGDGLSLYEHVHPHLSFRLWESKRHTGEGSLTSVVTRAGGQLRDNGAEYLARLSKPLQTHTDQRVQQLAGRVVRLWTVKDERCAVGVSVGTSTGWNLPNRPLRGLITQLGFPTRERYEGVVLQLDDLPAFAKSVRDVILGGIS